MEGDHAAAMAERGDVVFNLDNVQQKYAGFQDTEGSFFNPGTFLMEPRDESLMRKQKVIQILKTFQEEEPAGAAEQ